MAYMILFSDSWQIFCNTFGVNFVKITVLPIAVGYIGMWSEEIYSPDHAKSSVYIRSVYLAQEIP